MKTTYNYANTLKWNGSNPLEMPAALQESVLNVGMASGTIERNHTRMDYLGNLLLILVAVPMFRSFNMSFSLTWGNALEVSLYAFWSLIFGHAIYSLYETNREARRSVLSRSLEYSVNADELVIDGKTLNKAQKLKANKN